MIKVTIWNEFIHEKTKALPAQHYPDGIHNAIKEFLDADGRFEVKTATLNDENCGITQELLDDTDVLLWWGHVAHDKVSDETAELVHNAVLSGMGFIALHSAHHSKPFRRLMGTTCNLSWREDGDMERVWVIKPSHPIARGIDRWYEGGEIFRSGCCFYRGNGKIFYFQPGHETVPVFKNKNVQTVIKNAVCWAAPTVRIEINCPHIKKIGSEE